jgi:hypothetical protein
MAARQHPWNAGYEQAALEGSAHFGHYKNAPDTSKPAFALVRLSFNPAGARHVFEPGERVEAVLPADVLAAVIANGEATYDEERAQEAAKLHRLAEELPSDEFQRVRAAYLRGEPLPD